MLFKSPASRFAVRVLCYTVLLLLTLFITYYLALTVITSLPYDQIGILDEFTMYHDVFKGVNELIQEKLSGDLLHDQAVLEQLSGSFGYPLVLLDQTEFSRLPALVQGQFFHKSVAFDDDTFTYYFAYPFNDALILNIGPVVSREAIDSMSDTAIIFAIFFGLLSLLIIFMILLKLFLPLWKDALELKKFTENLSKTNFSQAPIKVKSWLFKPPADVINQLTLRVEKLLEESKVISLAMAHELRTPLAKIKYALLMLNEASETEREEELAAIQADLEALESLITVSLSYFRLQQYELTVQPTKIESERWFTTLLRELELLLSRDQQLIVSVESFIFMSDPKLLAIVIRNLVENAIKYSDSQIHITVKQEKSHIKIVVEDDGCGIPTAEYQNIFMPFQRLPDHHQDSGHGLGLAYVKLTLDYLAGDIVVSKSALGGAKFDITLPFVAPKQGD